MDDNFENLNSNQTKTQIWIGRIKHFFWLILPTVEKVLNGIIYYTIKIIKSIIRIVIEQFKS
jgi:hypothetical protein